MVRTLQVSGPGGRPLHVYDTGDVGDDRAVLLWHHGSPNTGEPPAPLLPAMAERQLRCISYDRPSYGGSAPLVGRDVATAAADVAAIAAALGVERLATIGHSGGGPHALACAALLPDLVTGVVSISGLAPFSADGLDWFAGMAASGAAELHAAVQGREALHGQLTAGDGDGMDGFTTADLTALAGDWRWLGGIAQQAMAAGLDGLIDDDLAFVAPWGFGPAQVTAPVLLVHGDDDRIVPSTHGEWLAKHVASAELWRRPGDGHISVLSAGAAALDWLLVNRRR